ncbi:hypothetical protein Rhopal_004213-T1 [Rhodotorula paludigena]|uniref:Uncharacterized protein n=1 Tax=Rhodotorula paludigena TaxID=86838 RepID=A0AAV5GMS7_9BASI|nr:hypothetical protein Rhopal_004213-T1 [Rhodotorula paludigena]
MAPYYAPRPRHKAPPPPSWTTVLTLGIVPTADSPSTPSRPPPPRDPLVLKFDPHHLYYLLLKFDELGMTGTGDLDVKVEGGTSRPMSVDFSGVPGAGELAGAGGASASLLGGLPGSSMLGFPRRDGSADDTRSIRSGISSFSFGSGWWGLGGRGGDAKKLSAQEQEAADVRYIYSSCTKLPALKLSPFHLVSASDGTPALVKAVEGFEDCPPDATCVPLHAFKNLSALVLEDLDPRGFLGWDVLSMQLRSLEVRRSGIEDLGELICDAPCEDLERRQREERRNKPVGSERRRRAEGLSESSLAGTGAVVDDSRPSTPSNAFYPTPPRHAWSSLRHLSLADSSLTFVPSPPLTFLPTLTSLDLSSNLLISIPPALAHLTSLRSLNLGDNMIESLLGVAKALGAIEVLNLSHNRLENLSGLDRLPALVRVDVRDNYLDDALEVSRLARLPHLREVWVRGNPFTRAKEQGGDEHWRTKCFGYFAEEDRLGHRDVDAGEIRIDGTGMSSSERRAVEAESSRRGTPLGRRRASVGAAADRAAVMQNGQQAKVVGRRVVTAPHRTHAHLSDDAPPLPPLPSTSGTTPAAGRSEPSPSKPPTPLKAKRRHKPRRIVDLDADPSAPSLSSAASTSHTQPGAAPSDSDERYSSATSGAESRSAIPRARSMRGLVSPVVEEQHASATDGTTDEALSSSPASRRRPAAASLGPAAAASPGKLSRRDRVSASLYEPPAAEGSEGPAAGAERSGDAFRRRIEQLRDEVGESWLSVLAEREARAEREKKKGAAGGERPEQHEAKEKKGNGGDPSGAAGAESQAAPAPAAPLEGVPVPKATAPPSNMPEEEDDGAAAPDAAPAPIEEPAEAAAAIPTTVKSVRKKKGKGKKKGGGGGK